MGHQLMVVRDEMSPGATDTFATEQGAGEEAVEDLDKDIIHEAGQYVSLIWGPPPYRRVQAVGRELA